MRSKGLRVLAIAVLCCVMPLATSCSSTAGRTLARGLANVLDYHSYEEENSVSFNIQVQDATADEQSVLDLLNQLEINSVGQIDADTMAASSTATLTVNGCDAELEAYTDGFNSWMKFPFESRYIEFSPDLTTNDFASLVGVQSQMREFMGDFFQNFSSGFDYDTGAITSLGKSTIDTPDGSVDVERIAVDMDTTQVRDLVVASLLYAAQDDTLIDSFLDEIEKIGAEVPEIDSVEELYQGADREETEVTVRLLLLGAAAELQEYDLSGDIGFEANLVFSVDGNDNLRGSEGSVEVTIPDTGSIGWTFDTTYGHINDVNVVIPDFDAGETVPFETWIEESPDEISTWIEETYGISIMDVNTVVFMQDSPVVYINGQRADLPAATYIKNGCTMIPVGVFVHNDVGITAYAQQLPSGAWQITMMHAFNSMVMETGSLTAVVNGQEKTLPQAPEVKNGAVMVPLAAMANALDVPYVWDPTAKSVTMQLTSFGF